MLQVKHFSFKEFLISFHFAHLLCVPCFYSWASQFAYLMLRQKVRQKKKYAKLINWLTLSFDLVEHCTVKYHTYKHTICNRCRKLRSQNLWRKKSTLLRFNWLHEANELSHRAQYFRFYYFTLFMEFGRFSSCLFFATFSRFDMWPVRSNPSAITDIVWAIMLLIRIFICVYWLELPVLWTTDF